MSPSRTPTVTVGWTPREIASLLGALEALGGPGAPRCAVSVGDHRVVITPEIPEVSGESRAAHRTLVQAGRLAGSVESVLRAHGWGPRTRIEAGSGTPAVTVVASRRRGATPLDLARRRAEHAGEGSPSAARLHVPADHRRVIEIARAASSRGVWLSLLNGPTREGLPSWGRPGVPPVTTFGLALPWRRDPVLAVCTRGDGGREAIASGMAVHRARVEASLRGVRVAVHVEVFDAAAARHGTGDGVDDVTVHAVLHLRG